MFVIIVRLAYKAACLDSKSSLERQCYNKDMFYIALLIGKVTQLLLKLRGGGSALPGLVVEKIAPRFLNQALVQLPRGVILVSGTNGKTTTTKIIAELLRSQNIKVFTNPSGSNFVRGVIASLLATMNWRGQLPADIAVLELDEAHALHFIRQHRPARVVLLNAYRDQLDRFGEVDTAAKLLQEIGQSARETVILNTSDDAINDLAPTFSTRVITFGVTANLAPLFPSDRHFRDDTIEASERPATVLLTDYQDPTATFQIEKQELPVTLTLTGAYNALNAAAALATVRDLVAAHDSELVQQLASITPAFGRGEHLIINGQRIDIVLVKNPSGFRLSLQTFARPEVDVMIAINDNFADGRDMSWLWDVDFTSLNSVVAVGGIRAYDMALRLQYDELTPQRIETDIAKMLAGIERAARPTVIFATYTAMLEIRQNLRKHGLAKGLPQ